jgi:MFS family permease
MGVACIWLGVASNKTDTSFLLGRVFLGVFEAPIESIVPSTVTDLFFLHDRGEKLSLYGLSVLGGNELGPMFSAFIIQYLGMNWAFYIIAMVIAANFITMFFFMPETKFTGTRPSLVADEGPYRYSKKLEMDMEVIENIGQEKTNESNETHKDAAAQIPVKGYVRELKPWGTNDPNVNLRKTFLRPFILMAYPTVLWSCLIYGFALGWNVILGATTAQLFAPPYDTSPP